jgi:hypothetical protein
MGEETQPPSRSPQPERPESSSPALAPASGEGERWGPLLITRQRKDDGRALLLYEERGEGR